ncbi:NUDIX domain-containing protein [soil metagenome]
MVTKVVAKAILQAPDGNILLLRRSATDTRRPLEWDLPGGNVEDEEDYHAACVREIDEETGIIMDSKELHLAYTTTEYFEEHGNVCWLFFVAQTDKTEIALSAEHDQSMWVSLDEAIKAIEYPRQKVALQHIQRAKLLH